MNPRPGNDWSEHDSAGREAPADDLEFNQRDKPMKALIGVGLLMALALLLSQMSSVPHDNPSTDPATTGQTVGSDSR